MLTEHQVNNLEKIALAFCAKQEAYLAEKKKKKEAAKLPALSEEKAEQVKRLVGCAKAHFPYGHWKGLAHIFSALLNVHLSHFNLLINDRAKAATAGICPDLLTRNGDGDPAFKKGVPVVPIKNPNEHNYALGRVCFISDPAEQKAYRLSNDDLGNHLPDLDDGEPCPLRVATAKEVKAALAAYWKKAKHPVAGSASDIGF